MAPTTLLAMALALAAVSIQGTLGKIECENLNVDSCSLAVSSTGNRCVLESHSFGRKMGTMDEYTCRTSEIKASNKITDHIETDECFAACRVEKRELGISSDSLLDRNFIDSFCSDSCYNNCPNIVDLYFNLAAGEGVFIPTVCARRHLGGRREMIQLQSTQNTYLAPTSSLKAALNAVSKSPSPSPSQAQPSF